MRSGRSWDGIWRSGTDLGWSWDGSGGPVAGSCGGPVSSKKGSWRRVDLGVHLGVPKLVLGAPKRSFSGNSGNFSEFGQFLGFLGFLGFPEKKWKFPEFPNAQPEKKGLFLRPLFGRPLFRVFFVLPIPLIFTQKAVSPGLRPKNMKSGIWHFFFETVGAGASK